MMKDEGQKGSFCVKRLLFKKLKASLCPKPKEFVLLLPKLLIMFRVSGISHSSGNIFISHKNLFSSWASTYKLQRCTKRKGRCFLNA